MNLADTILFIEAREAGNRSAGVLSSGNLASNQINIQAKCAHGATEDSKPWIPAGQSNSLIIEHLYRNSFNLKKSEYNLMLR